MTVREGPARRYRRRWRKNKLAMAVPTSVTSTTWSRRPTTAGQSRSEPASPCRRSPRPRRRAVARPVPARARRPAGSGSPVPSSRPSRRCPTTGGPPGGHPVVVPRPDRDAEYSPAGAQPAAISRAKSCPDRAEVKGNSTARDAPAETRTAVPRAVNSSPPRGRTSRGPAGPPRPRDRQARPPRAVIRSTAARLAWYMASTSGPEGTARITRCRHLAGRPRLGDGCPGTTLPAGDPGTPGQLDPLADPAA